MEICIEKTEYKIKINIVKDEEKIPNQAPNPNDEEIIKMVVDLTGWGHTDPNFLRLAYELGAFKTEA